MLKSLSCPGTGWVERLPREFDDHTVLNLYPWQILPLNQLITQCLAKLKDGRFCLLSRDISGKLYHYDEISREQAEQMASASRAYSGGIQWFDSRGKPIAA